MMMLPKGFNKVLKKLDVRVHPDPELAKKFDSSCSRRYINVGLHTISFFQGISEKVADKEMIEYADNIKKAIYIKDGNLFEVNKNLFLCRMRELGLWKSAKGISSFQKVQLLRKFRKMVKKKGLDKGGKQ